jgi:hypothetical protein
MEVARKKPECEVNTTFLVDKVAAVTNPARYQILTVIAEEHLDEKRYDSAQATYLAASKLYEEANLASQFLMEVTIPAQARNPRYAGFAVYQGEKFLQNDQLDSALVMAQAAVDGRFPKDAFRDFTMTLANKLAEKDKLTLLKTEAKEKAQSYSKSDKKLKDFEKAYLKAWGLVD